MKKVVMFFLMLGGVCFLGQNQGCSSGSNPEAVSAYKQFMDHWIVQDYTRALEYTTGDAAAKVSPHTRMEKWGRTIERPPGGYGVVEESRIEVLKETESNNRIYLEVTYSASISWDGSTANPMSPGSWKHYNQKATIEKVGGVWKVAGFSGEGANGG